MATRVVDQLEAVEVEEHDRDERSVGPRFHRGQRPQELGPVDQAGERVAPGLAIEPQLGQPVLGDVVEDDEHHVAVRGAGRRGER